MEKKKNLTSPLSQYRVMWTCPVLELLQVKYSKAHHKQPTEGKPVLPYASIPAGKSNGKRDGLGYNCSTVISTFPHLNSSLTPITGGSDPSNLALASKAD